ncbi:D-aspartate oxidase isoform X2 [Osmerus mordax]|uniref:D-aspartate oxidase n=1 Tax=Osmerus mordax TaxID=8014 RepID=C1BLJ8_OSMMO|nr:D-aspartate oxidase [Osmerus mordax]
MKSVKIVVVGAGVVGFSTAVCIAEVLPFCSVTLLADQFTPDTTSDVAAGIVFASEFPEIPLERQRRWFKESFDHLLAIAQSQESSDAGVLLSSGWQIFKDVPADKNPFWSEYVLGFRTMSARELKRFPNHKFGQAFTTIKCECSTYLPWLENRFIKAGGQIIRKRVSSLEELGPSYDLIVNCCGLGSRSLVGDEEVDQGDSEGILERCSRLEPSLSRAQVLGEWVGLRPGRRNPRLARELVLLGGRQVPVVHNYGHGGWGVALSWGTALDALGLIRSWLYENPPKARL